MRALYYARAVWPVIADALIAVATVACAAGIGVLLAWRG